MRTHVADHPLVAHKLTALRDERTDSPTFRRLADELVTLLAYEATRDVRTEAVEITTPGGARPRACGWPRRKPAGRADPAGRARHARRHDAAAADGRGRLPRHDPRRVDAAGVDLRRPGCPRTCPAGRCYVLDPMLATGGTLVAAIKLPAATAGADDVTAICLLAAPEGLAHDGGRPSARRRRRSPS